MTKAKPKGDLRSSQRRSLDSGKLSVEDVRRIREKLIAGKKVAWIAEHFEVTPACIYNIHNGKTWTWVK